MTVDDQFKALTRELQSRQEAVRNFNETNHHQSDGEWKESLLREVLQRHLPKNFEPVRGFVTSGEASTGQIDIMLYDSGKPVRFRDSDMLLVTPDSVAGVIEVKSAINSVSKLEQALVPLVSNIELIRTTGNKAAFAGLFSFETKLVGHKKLRRILECLRKVSGGVEERVVDLVALGDAVFVLNWAGPDPHGYPSSGKRRWYAYNLPQMAPGYFISNVVRSVAPESVERYAGAWFPKAPPREPGLVDQEDLGFGVAVYPPVKLTMY